MPDGDTHPAKKKGLSRREVLALGAAGAGAGLASVLVPGAGWRFVPPEYPGKGKIPLYDMVVPTTCTECGDGCGLICFIQGSRLIAVQGNPDHPGNRGSICLKSFAGINQIYDPERVTVPKKRKGPRGSGLWEDISWEEALALVARGIAPKGKAAPGLFFEDGSYEESAGFLQRFLDAAGVRMRLFRRDLEEANVLEARRSTFGVGHGFPRVEGARYILNFGADPLESGRFFLVLAKRIVESVLLHRAKVVTFDPRLSNTAARSHEWFPLAPGAEGLVALAIAGEVVRAGRYDRAFVEARTDTSHAELLRHLAPYTPEAVEKADGGVPAAVVRRVAWEFASEGPSIAICGTSAVDREGGFENQRAVDLLNVLAGAVDRPGGIDLYPDLETYFAPVDPVPPRPETAGRRHLVEALETEGAVQAYFSHRANPAFAKPDTERIRALLADEKRLPCLVVCDTHLTETAQLADVFLPAATPFETWGIQPGFETVSLRRPAAGFLGEMPALRSPEASGLPFSRIRRLCRPLGKSRALDDVLMDLARRMGPPVAKYMAFDSILGYLAKACEGGPVFGKDGFQRLLEEQFVRLPGSGAWRRKGFPTPSRTIELKPAPATPGAPSPGLPTSTWKRRPLDVKTFVLLPYLPSTSKPVSSNAKWLFEVIHDNPLWIHSRAAEALGLSDGDRVRLTSEAGSVEAAVHVTEGIHPEAVAMARGFGHTACGHIARAEPFESEDPDTSLLWWQENGPGVNPCRLVRAATDEAGGGLAWMDTEVRLEKLP